MAAAFDYIGPAATLVRRLKYADQPYLSKGAGAFLAAQWIHLNWPPPDFLVPVPLSFMHWMERGYNQSRLLCESMSRILNVPIADVLRRKSGDYSQAALSRKQRVEFEHHTIELKKNPSLLGKTLLLVDDVMTTGTTLRKCGEVLLEGRPAKLYSLVLCRAMR
jgi:ComF family protein